MYIANLIGLYDPARPTELQASIQNLIQRISVAVQSSTEIPETVVLVMICNDISFAREFTKQFRLCAVHTFTSEYLKRFVFHYVPLVHIRNTIPAIFSEYFPKNFNNKKEDTMAIKRAKKFVVVGSEFAEITSRLLVETIQRGTPYQFDTAITEYTEFVICFTDSITRNFDDQYMQIDRMMNQIHVHRRSLERCPVLFINLIRFPSEVLEVEAVKNLRKVKTGTKSKNESVLPVNMTQFMTDHTEWVSLSATNRHDPEHLNLIVRDFMMKLAQSQPQPQVQPETANTGNLKLALDAVIRRLQPLEHAFENFDNFRTDLDDRLNTLSAVTESLSNKYDRIVYNPDPIMEKFRELIKFKEDTTDKWMSLEDTVSQLVDARVKEVLSKMESSLAEKLSSTDDPDEDLKSGLDPAVEQQVDAAVQMKVQTEDNIFFDVYSRNILSMIYSQCGEECVTVVNFDPLWNIDKKLAQFEKMLTMNSRDFILTYPDFIVNADGTPYAPGRAWNSFRKNKFNTILDFIVTPNARNLQYRLNNRLSEIIDNTLYQYYGVRIKWMTMRNLSYLTT